MNDRMQERMAEATRLTRAGRILEATALIQQTLQDALPAYGTTPTYRTTVTPENPTDPIDAEFRVVDDTPPSTTTSTEPPLPGRIPQSLHFKRMFVQLCPQGYRFPAYGNDPVTETLLVTIRAPSQRMKLSRQRENLLMVLIQVLLGRELTNSTSPAVSLVRHFPYLSCFTAVLRRPLISPRARV
jgi:hypothetical protein